MDKVLSPKLLISCFMNIDDVIVFSNTVAEAIECTFCILDLIRPYNLKIGDLKYYFLLSHIQLSSKSIEAEHNFQMTISYRVY